MRNRALSVHIMLAIVLSTLLSAAAQAVQPLRVSGNNRMLVQQNGAPFFWMGDTNWRLYKLTREQVNQYLDNRKAKKFNVIQGPVLITNRTDVDFTNAYGENNTDPANPNESWFEHIDYIVNAAEQRGMYVALVAAWGDSIDVFSSSSQAKQYGRWLGERYRDHANVIWIAVGEYASSGTDSQAIGLWSALGRGLSQGSNGNNLITVHGSFQAGNQSSSAEFQNADWLDFNMIQSSQSGDFGDGAENWRLVNADYRKSPHKPTIDGEANYEGMGGWDAFGVRRRAYWSVFAGAFGHTYGANGVWSSYRGDGDDTEGGASETWDQAMNDPGAGDMKFLRRLIESRPMLKRVPNGILIGGGGGGPGHIQGARDSSGRWAMVYVPQANRQFTVDMNKISGSTVKAWWFRPSNGSASSAGTFQTNGAQTFTTPGNGEDWVLVLDDKSRGYPKPGTGGPLP